MKRKFSVAMMTCIIFMASCFTAFAETLFFNERLAKAVSSAKLTDKSGRDITASFLSQDSGTGSIIGYVTLSVGAEEVEASSIAEIDFYGVELDKITLIDFDSFSNYFPGLKTLRLPLPVSCKGTFDLSSDSLSELDVSGSSSDFILNLYGLPKIKSVKASDCPELKAINLAKVDPADNSFATTAPTADGKVLTPVLSSLTDIDLSNCPNLSRVGFLLATTTGSSIGG